MTTIIAIIMFIMAHVTISFHSAPPKLMQGGTHVQTIKVVKIFHGKPAGAHPLRPWLDRR